ncbi:TonB-dependent receptor [Nostoc sp. CHAB 5784]|uniref:TonB-dependent receptor n=1 Tax=Nostoc mirabile TaxID=2907820 RepID=UPI001E562D5A|nr:TonB-dependent receptor [Nostoc mirabile]MCC5668810.1 TonB-dependent receptor [Nostoc mirabile CHAB5784]
MKPRLDYVNTFNLRLMGAMPVVALSLILYPAIVKAEPVNEDIFLPDSPSQADKGVEDPDFSPDLENSLPFLSPTRGEALNSPPSLVGKGARGLGSALVFPDNVKSSEQQVPPHKFPSSPTTDTSIPDVQASETEIQPFQPAISVGLPRGLRKIAGIENKNDGGKDTETQLQASPRQIQPFQPASSVGLPRGLSKIAGVENGQGVNENLPVSPTPAISTVIKILTPTPDSVVDVPATTVTVQFTVGSQVELRVNGVLVDSSLVGRTESDATTNLLTQTWYGVSLKEGKNTISAQVVGGTEPPVTVQVAVRGAPQQLTLETVESRIPADGRSTATIRGQLIDASGNRSNRDAVVTLIATAGEFVGKDFFPDEPGFQVEAKGGQFTGILRSQLKAETVRIRAIANDLEAFTQLQFETALRPSLVTGVVDLRLGARGTNYYGSFRDFLPPDKDNGTQLDFRSAVFATGAIGEWLFTGAYNSSRSLNEDCNCDNRLFRTYQFSEQNYPVYGDSSKVDVVAPSIDSVYLRFERSTGIPGSSPDYAMWGDYNTEEFARRSQQFTSITRQLHGFKANYNLGNLQITGLYGNHLEGFQRDTIAPDGTSGYYFLSRRILQPGSENVFIELEELNRPGTVLERKQLNRGPDYEIDYDRGTLLFREPILRTDIDQTGQVLVRRIVVSYQYDSEDSDSNIYAGRLQYNLSRKLNSESWIGATYVQENQGVRDFQLYGADALISLGDRGRLIAEYAHSTNDSDVVGKVSGDAYRLEAEGQIANGIQGRAYYRFADTGFANNATISFVPGQTRYGAQVTAKLASTTNVRVQYDHEDNFGIAPQPLDTFEELFAPRNEAIPGSKVDNSLTTISAGIQQRLGKATIDVDWIHRHREDRIPDSALSSTSDQLRSRFSVPIAKNLTFQAQNELSLSSQKDTVYPDRTIFGLNWAAIPGVNISLAQQFYTSGQYSGNSITSLSVNGEHKLGSDTTLTGRYSILGGANEMTTQGAIGLNNRWTIASGLRLNVAYEHVFGNFFGRTGAGQQYAQPFAFGQSASAIGFDGGDSYSVGLEYSDNPQFQASARYEHRSSSSGSNTVITAGVTGKISPALTALVRYQQAGSSNQKLSGLGDTANLKLGLAYRDPNSDKFNALLRYEYRQNPSTIPDTILLGSGTGSQDHTFALEAIYAPNWQWEFYGKYALRNSTSYIASDLAGTSTVNLAQLRATYRLGYSWDLVGEARVISQPNYSETGFVVETGYYLTPNLRLSAGYVFGKVDDRDFSGTRSAGGAYLGITVKLNELFDGFGQQKIPPRQPQESAMKTLVNKLKAATTAMQKREI